MKTLALVGCLTQAMDLTVQESGPHKKKNQVPFTPDLDAIVWDYGYTKGGSGKP